MAGHCRFVACGQFGHSFLYTSPSLDNLPSAVLSQVSKAFLTQVGISLAHDESHITLIKVLRIDAVLPLLDTTGSFGHVA